MYINYTNKMASAIVDGTNIDLSVFSYSAPKPNPSGGKVVNLYNKHAKESLTISVPLMGSWGAQEVKTNEGVGTGKYTMTLQFSKGQYTTPEADKFLEQIKGVENKIKQDAMIYSKEWFGKEIKSMDVMDEKFTPMLKYPKVSKNSEERNYSEPPQLNLKLPCWKGVWQTSVFDEDYNPLYVKGKTDGELTPLDFLRCPNKAPIQVICLIQCAGLWFVGSPAKVSITWNLKQVIVRKPKTSAISDDTCFLTIRPADREALKAQPEMEVQVVDTSIVSAQVDDSDNEEYTLPPPAPVAQVPTPVAQVTTPVAQVTTPVAQVTTPVAQVTTPVAQVTEVASIEENKPKKKIVSKKKPDA
jgi:hypothetical protein